MKRMVNLLQDLLQNGIQYQQWFFSPKTQKPTLGPTQPPTQWVPEVLSPGVKQPGRGADHSPPCCTEVKNERNLPPLLQYAFTACIGTTLPLPYTLCHCPKCGLQDSGTKYTQLRVFRGIIRSPIYFMYKSELHKNTDSKACPFL
jgi:hypothetical protein